MTRQELDERLLDYLYDELEPSERGAFERALPAHPEVLAEVEAHRATRSAYQGLPREVAPAGIFADVLAQADAEAVRRAKLKDHVPLWDKIRRVLFQPAFAMAMVVLLVAGVSLINAQKNQLPGMEPARDSQRLPPVAMEAAPAVRGATTEAEREGLRAMVAKKAEEAAADQELAAAPEPVAATLADGVEAPALARSGEAAAEGKDASQGRTHEAPKPAVSPAAAGADKREAKAPAQMAAPDSDKAKNVPAPAGKAIGGVAGDVTVGDDLGQAFVVTPERREAVDSKPDPEAGVWEDTRRPSNTITPAPRAPTETTDKPADVARDDKMTDSDVLNERDLGPAKPVAPRPQVVEPSKVAVTDSVTKNAEKVDAPQPPAAPKEEQLERVATKTADSPTTDDGDSNKKKDNKPATLTPPAATPETLWSTYRKQSDAGAYADALRSIEALAKVEGESTRVKEARAALKKQLDAAKRPADGANKVPPDPPVAPPK